MITRQDLQGLIEYRPDAPVLSVYFDLDPASGSADTHRLRLRRLLEEFQGRADRDIDVILRYMDHGYEWSGRSLAMFSCAASELWRAYSIGVPLRTRARLMERPYVKPLADLFDTYGDYGVALVDQQGARLFHFHLGELFEQEGTVGEAVRHTKRGGGSQALGRRGGTAGQTRRAEELVERNIKEAARFAARFFAENRVRRVVIGGTEANVSRFTSQLPKQWRSLIAGTFPMDMTAGHAQVFERAMQVARGAEQERQARIVEAIVTAAAKGREGVIGLDDTLEAVRVGRVQALVIQDGLRSPAYRCQQCGHFTAQHLDPCPFCGGSVAEIDDAVEYAVREVLAAGGDVEVVRENPALEKAGGVAALLRYRT